MEQSRLEKRKGLDERGVQSATPGRWGEVVPWGASLCPLGTSLNKWYDLQMKMSPGFWKPKPTGFGAGIGA